MVAKAAIHGKSLQLTVSILVTDCKLKQESNA